jgi:membrane-associated phospholipid phosphatase
MYGLVAFPSYHCIAAILFMWASWTVHSLRPFMVAVNLLMLAATPIVGGHYFVDLVAGALIVPPSIVLVEWLYSKALKMDAQECARRLIPTMAFDFSRVAGTPPIALRDGRGEQPPRIGK